MKLAQKLGLAYYRANLKLLELVSPEQAAKRAFKLFSTPFLKQTGPAHPVFTDGELLSFLVNETLVSGFRWNHPSKKKVLIVHGFESNSDKFHEYIMALRKEDFEVLAFDAPAHGRSAGKRILLPQYVDMLVAVLEKYGPIDHFVAHSFGGLAIAHTLEKTPQGEGIRIALIAPATETSSAIDRFFRIFSLGTAVRKHFDKIVIKKGGHPLEYYSIRRAMKNFKASILWIHDETDKVTPLSDALKVRDDGYPDLEFIVTNGLGHRRIYKDAETVKKVVGFIAAK